MNLETETTIMIALLPFLAVWALLDLSRRIQRRREEWVARQIALTDAIHREGTVGVITRLTQDLFRRLDRQDPPQLRLVLIPQAVRPWQQGRVVDSTRPAGRLSRAA